MARIRAIARRPLHEQMECLEFLGIFLGPGPPSKDSFKNGNHIIITTNQSRG